MHHAMFFIFLAAIIPQDRPEMRSLVEAERAFAAASVEKGAREAFTANFADDGIAFQPHPVVYKKAMKNRPLPANPKAFTLDWKPVFGDVSESGDLGYTTGPYSLVDNSGKQPTRYGFYFSVWKKVSGQWQVALDIGIRTPTDYEGGLDFRQAQSWGKTGKSAEPAKNELKQAEEDFLSLVLTKGSVAAYKENIAADCRLHLDGRQPILGKTEIVAFLGVRSTFDKGKLLHAGVSRSNDLGFSYGSYESGKGKPAKENGYFGHVWKRNEGGKWKLVAEILSPIPPENP